MILDFHVFSNSYQKTGRVQTVVRVLYTVVTENISAEVRGKSITTNVFKKFKILVTEGR